MTDLNKILDIAKAAALEAGEFVKSIRASGEIGLQYKRARDMVTAADLGANEIIIKQIKETFPDHRFLSEESNPEEQDYSGKLWIIDPVDGTTNFARGHSNVGISIAYAEEGKVLVGIVNAPFQEEVFTAVKGGGAYLNSKKIQPANYSELENALVVTGFPYLRDNLSVILKRLNNILIHCQDVRRLGACSLDLCWVACGRLDAYYEDVKPWDMAAGALILKEAGGVIDTLDGFDPTSKIPDDLYATGMLACNKQLHKKLLEILKV